MTLASINSLLLDISKAFDKAWHGVTFKLHQNGTSVDIINVLQDFLHNRKQRVVLNGHCLSWADVSAGVLKGSVLESFFLYIYIYFIDLS